MKNPIQLRIYEKQEEIKKEVALKTKPKIVNKTVVITSLLLLLSTLIGLVNILTDVFK